MHESINKELREDRNIIECLRLGTILNELKEYVFAIKYWHGGGIMEIHALY